MLFGVGKSWHLCLQARSSLLQSCCSGCMVSQAIEWRTPGCHGSDGDSQGCHALCGKLQLQISMILGLRT